MSQEFFVGEVAIYVRPDSKFFGTEVTIISPLHPVYRRYDYVSRTLKNETIWAYGIESITGMKGGDIARPEHLRKKRPPEALSSWDKVQEICGWRPREVSNV